MLLKVLHKPLRPIRVYMESKRKKGEGIINELRSLLPKTAAKSFFFFSKKHINFWGQTNYVARFETKLSRLKTLLAFALNGPEIVFFEKHVSDPFLRNRLSPIFEAKWNMWRISIQNCPGRKLRSLLPKTAPKSFF